MSPSIAAGAPEEIVRALAAQEFNAAGRDIDLAPLQGLAARQACRFFQARNLKLVGGPAYGYAVLPDQTVLGPRDKGRAARILVACGEGADAPWWANVVARFGDDACGLLVDEYAPSAIRGIRASGAQDHRPVLSRTVAGTTVNFYTHDVSLGQTWHVRATLTQAGELRVDRQMIPQ